MESRYNVGGRSSLFSRRSNRTADGGGGGYDGGGGGGGMVVGARVGRYDRNRFAKLDLGLEAAPSPPTTLTAESYDSGRSLIDLGKLGLLGDSGRVSRVYDGPPSLTTARTGGLLGRIGLPTYGNGITGNVGSILDTGTTKPNDVVHRSDDAYDFGLTGTHDSGTYGTRYGGTVGTYNDGTTETFLRGTAGTYNETHNGTGETHYGGTAEHYNDDITGPYRSITGPSNGTYDDGPSGTYGERTSVEGVSSDDDVIYYHLIDNYTIFQLETVEDSMPLPSSKMTTPASTPPATPSALKPLGLSLSTIRGSSSGDLPVHKKLNLIKNLQILIEELQQKVTRLQIEVEEQDIATSFCNSKFGSNRSKDSATTCSSTESSDMKEPFSSISSSSSDTCDVNRCRHVDELQLLKRQNAALLQEKCHLEEQIVQLRSLKSIVHGTDSEKRVTKLEAENVQLQKQLAQTIDQLRQQQQQHTVIPGGEGLRGGGGVDEESTYPNVASTVQQYESRKYETDSRVNGGGVERLKERQNLIDAKASSSFSSSSSTSQAAAAKHHSHLSSAAESLQLQQPSSLSASDAVNMDMYKRNLLADIGRLPQSVNAEVKRWTSDEGPEVDQDRDLGSCTEGNQMSLKEQTKDNMDAEARGIRVLCRLRPALKDEQGLAECVFPTTTTTTMTTDSPSSSSSSSSVVQLMYRGRMKSFEVDHIIPATDDSQQRVIDDLRGHVVSCIDGQSFNVIAYGETGSGKTFTIQGSGDKPGIVQRTTALLLDEVKRRRTAAAVAGDDDEDCQLTMSIIEIYNETIRDLLSSDPNHKVDMKPTSDGGAAIPGLTCIQIESGSDATKILKRGQDNRCSKQVAAADHSSRSHLIITIEITRPNRTNEKRIYGGRVNLIDLAGSERIEKTGVDAARFKEAQSINKSLTCLGDVLYALLARQTHVPFRSSKLTHLLQDAFVGPNSSTALIVHIASVEKRASETMSTLMFAQRVRAIEAAAAMTPHSSSVRGAGGPSSEGGSGSRTPVEPISQRPRRPSVSGISDRLSVFERRPSISRGPSNSPASAARRPSGAIASASAAAAATAQARQRSKSRTENRITGGGGGKGGDGGGGGGGSGGGGSGSGGGAGGVVSPVASRPRSAMKCLPPTPKK